MYKRTVWHDRRGDTEKRRRRSALLAARSARYYYAAGGKPTIRALYPSFSLSRAFFHSLIPFLFYAVSLSLFHRSSSFSTLYSFSVRSSFFLLLFLVPYQPFPPRYLLLSSVFTVPSPPLSLISLCSNGSRSFPSATSLLLIPSMFSMHLPLPFCTVASFCLSPRSLPVFSPLHFFSRSRDLSLSHAPLSPSLSACPSSRSVLIAATPSRSLSLSLSHFSVLARYLRETRSCQSSDQPPTRAGTRQCDTYMRSLLATLARLFRRARISTRVSAYATDVLVHVTLRRGCLPTKEAPRLFNMRRNISQDTSFVCLLLRFGIY